MTTLKDLLKNPQEVEPTKVKVSYYDSPRDGMSHADLYVISEGVACWAGHLCMPSLQWSAFMGVLWVGSEGSEVCEIDFERAYTFQQQQQQEDK